MQSSGVGGGGQTGNTQGVWVKDEKWVLSVFVYFVWLFRAVLGIEARTSCMAGKYSTPELYIAPVPFSGSEGRIVPWLKL